MSHHGRNPLEHENPLLRKLLTQAEATGDPLKDAQRKLQGEYPNGRMSDADEGALAMMVGHENGKVVMQFASPTAWIGFTPEQAMDIAQMLITHARQAGIVGVYTIKL